MRPVFNFWRNLTKRFFKPVRNKKKGILLSYIKNQNPHLISFETVKETHSNIIFVPRLEPGQLKEDVLIVMYLKVAGDLNRYGLWFYGEKNGRVRFEIRLFKAPEKVYGSLYDSCHSCLAENNELEKENTFYLNPEKQPYLLIIQEENEKKYQIPIWFENLI